MKNSQQVDFMAFGAHPDDVDACAGGLVCKLTRAGLRGVKVDLTSGDLANTGSGSRREQEAQIAAKVMGFWRYENLGLPDRQLAKHPEFEDLIVERIRQYRPRIVIAPAWEDKHVDHVACSELVTRALSGAKYEKVNSSHELPAHRVSHVFYYPIHYELTPTFIVDISDVYAQKMEAFTKHTSQLYKDGTNELLDQDFVEYWESRARTYGYKIGARYGEPYVMKTPLGLDSVLPILQRPLL